MNAKSVRLSRLAATLGLAALVLTVLLGLLSPRSVTAQAEPDKTWESQVTITQTAALGPSTVNGTILAAWVDHARCGGTPEAWSYITYQGGVVASQTHILYTSAWARGVIHIDNLNAPPNWIVTWGSGTGMNPNYPQPGLPLYWDVTQEATDNVTGASLLYQTHRFECPTVQSKGPVVGIPVYITLTEANASSYGLQLATSPIVTNTSGNFTHTFTRTGEVSLTVTAYGLGTSVSKLVTFTVISPTADLAISQPEWLTATLGVPFSWTVDVINNGPDDATNVSLFHSWPGIDAEVISVDPDECQAPSPWRIECLWPTFTAGTTVRVNVYVTPVRTSRFGVWSKVESQTSDPNLSNNEKLTHVTIVSPTQVYTTYLPIVTRSYCPTPTYETEGLSPFPQVVTINTTVCDHTRYGSITVPTGTVVYNFNPIWAWIVRGIGEYNGAVLSPSGAVVSFTVDMVPPPIWETCTSVRFRETDISGNPIEWGFDILIGVRIPDC